MSDIYDCKIVTTRKPHVCEFCGRPIEPNTPAVLYEHGLFDGVFFKRWSCPQCVPLLGEFWDYVDDESSNIVDDWSLFLEECHPELVNDDDDD